MKDVGGAEVLAERPNTPPEEEEPDPRMDADLLDRKEARAKADDEAKGRLSAEGRTRRSERFISLGTLSTE